MGADKQGLTPQISQISAKILDGKPSRVGVDRGLFRAYGGLVGLTGPILPHVTRTREEQKLPRKWPFWPDWRLLGQAQLPSPRLDLLNLSDIRGQKLNTNCFFSKLFGHRRDVLAKSRDIPPKKFDFPGFEGHTELFGPHPFMWKTPTPPENIRAQKFRFGFLFRA